MPNHTSFGDHLRYERKKLNYTVQMFAENCGISRSYISLIENGQRLPGKKIIPKIAVALKLKTSVVLNWYLEELSQKMHVSFKLSQSR